MENKDMLNALARIKVIINNYYEKVGRREIEELGVESLEIIEEIDSIIKKLKIPSKYVVSESLKNDYRFW